MPALQRGQARELVVPQTRTKSQGLDEIPGAGEGVIWHIVHNTDGMESVILSRFWERGAEKWRGGAGARKSRRFRAAPGAP